MVERVPWHGGARARRAWPLAASGIALLVAMVGAAAVGSVPIPPADVAQAVVRGLVRALGWGSFFGVADAAPTIAETIVVQIRLPRVVGAAVVGAGLALAGAAFQGVFRNPLADPYLLGAASGAGLAAASVMVFGSGAGWLAGWSVGTAAFAGATLAVVVVVALARRGRRVPVVPLVLAGVVVGSCLSAATSLTLLAAREQAAGVLAWLLGSFAFASWDRLLWAAPAVGVAGLVVLMAARGLDVLQLGETAAAQLGLPVEPFKAVLVVAATLATAAAVATAGVIGFVGLLVPHAVRLAVGPSHGRMLPLSALWGATFLTLADLVARTLIAPAEVPVGVVTAIVGAPLFLLLLRREGGER
jgi:iron complex transport system permease protein